MDIFKRTKFIVKKTIDTLCGLRIVNCEFNIRFYLLKSMMLFKRLYICSRVKVIEILFLLHVKLCKHVYTEVLGRKYLLTR